MKKRILSLLLVVLMLASAIPVASTYASENAEELSVWLVDDSGAEQPAEDVALYRGGAVCLAAHWGAAVSGGLQWQIASGDEWINIQGATADTLRVSYGMVAALLVDDTARLRCTVGEFESKAVTIRVTEENPAPAEPAETLSAPEPLPAPEATVSEPVTPETEPTPEAESTPETESTPEDEVEADHAPESKPTPEPTGEEGIAPMALDGETELPPLGATIPDTDTKYYTVKIEYLYAASSALSGQTVAQMYVGEFLNTSSAVTVNSPNRIGYEPVVGEKTITITPSELTADTTITVYYYPAEVSYTVRHYQQNLTDDEYTLVETELKTGTTEAETADDTVAKDYAGFTALAHYPEKIAANSSTVIDVYYDRDYYMITFDLDGGSGTEPVYARYGAPISVTEPQKAGYGFAGWTDAAAATATEKVDLPATMPVGNCKYRATWTTQTVPFTVVYWLQNPNDPDKYDYRLAWQGSALAGSTIDITKYQDFQDHFEQSQLDPYAVKYSYYDHYNGDTTVKGDGSSVLNVYYKRKEFTLRFYYAISTESAGTGADEGTDNRDYYVVGGSTYAFGAGYKYGTVDTNDEKSLIRQYIYAYDNGKQIGQVTDLPKLNDKGAARGYEEGAETDTVTVNGVAKEYKYHYISFTARYGQNISRLWPCDVFASVGNKRTAEENSNGWEGTTSVVSAWNGEHHVYYSQHNSNQTIKGNYSELDYKLLWADKFVGEGQDDSTVSYLCFWENGAQVNWNVPKLFRYQIWVKAYEREDIEGRETKTKNGATYYLLERYDTCDNSKLEEQTPPAINGFTYTNIKDSETIEEFDKDVYQSAIAVNFYYTRNRYELTFKNGDNTVGTPKMVYYEQDITGLAPDTEDLEHYDVAKRDGGCAFAYWGETPDGISEGETLAEIGRMPNSKLTLYANWTSVTHTVKVYQTDEFKMQLGGDITVPHDTMAPQTSWPDDPEMGQDDQMEFLGWFYKDQSGAEHAFSFESTPVAEDLNIYAKWRSHMMKRVTIKYCVEDESGALTDEEVAPSETLMLRVGQTRTFDAKTGTQLYVAYQEGCFPITASHSITLTADSPDQSEYIFRYRKDVAVPYTVYFKVREPNGTVRPAFKVDENGKAVFMDEDSYSATEYVEKHEDNRKAIVAEIYVPDDLANPTWTLPSDYLPNALYAQKVIEYGKENTITFYYDYTPGTDQARYTVIHYVEDAAQTGAYAEKEKYDLVGTVGHTVAANPIAINGYTFDATKTQAMLGGNTYNAATQQVSGTVVSGHTLVLELYYSANEYPYRVLYLDKDTEQELLPEKTTGSDGRLLKAKFGATVTESAPTIDGYNVDGSAAQTLVIQQEANENKANLNTIVFYYKKRSGDLCITKQVTLDAEQAEAEGFTDTNLPDAVLAQEFTFTVTSPKGLPKNVYDYTVTEAGKADVTGKTAVANGQSVTVNIKSGQSVTINDLPLGDYTVTEESVPGFRSVVDNTIRTSVPVVLETQGATKTVVFENQYPFYTGDLVVRKALANGSIIAGDYTIRVTLQPDAAARAVERKITWTEGTTAKEYTIPAWVEGGQNETEFTIDVTVSAGTEAAPNAVVLAGVPAGSFTAVELPRDATKGSITDYYKVYHNYVLHRTDTEQFVLGSSVTGAIHGGHPTAVTFGNVPKTGGLTIEKTVTQEYAGDSFQSDAFEFTVTGYSELPAGAYSVNGGAYTATVAANGNVTVKDASGNDPQITVTKGLAGTSWTQTLALTGLPAGKYTVTEVAKTGYTCQQENAQVTGLQVGGTTAPTAAFTNTFDRTSGDLTVSKTIELTKSDDGITIDSVQTFEFTLLLTDGTLSGSYGYTKGTENGALAVADGKLSFTLKHNESITINGLPVGKYRVLETKVAGYGSSFAAIAGDNDHTEAQVTLTTDEKKTVACVNSYPVDSGTLVVKKQVVTPAGYNAIDVAPVGDRFQFKVSISGFDAKITSLESFVQSEFRDANGTALASQPTVTVTQSGQSGTLSFTLGAGESVALTLPNGTFTVSETALVREAEPTARLADHYTTAYTVNGAAGTADQEYTLSGTTQPITAEFTNTYKRHYADLTIVTNAEGYSNQNFIFDVASVTDSTFALQVILGNKDSRTIKDLPVGQYTVTERNDWSWREEEVAPQETTPFDLSTGSKTATFNYDAVDRTKWLSGYSYNIGKEG